MKPNTHQTALITGASRGLGLALAKGLAERGWQLILDARGEEALNEAHSAFGKYTTVIAIAGDVSDAAHRRELARAAATLGGLDVVVNNAGVLGPSPQPALLDYPLDVLEQVYRANVIAPLGVLQAVREHLKPGARILNITSDAGVEPYAGWGGYGSSKAALEQMSAILATENPSWRVYWVDPGDMRTQMHQDAFPGEDISDRPMPEASVPGFIALIEGEYASGRYKAREVGQPQRGIRETRIVLTANDFDATKRLLQGGLGLKTEKEWRDDEGNGIVLDAGHATIEVLDEADAARTDRVETGKPARSRVRLALHVSDVLSSSNAMQQRGAVALGEAKLTPWDHFNQRLQTPDGVQVTLFEERSVESVESVEVEPA